MSKLFITLLMTSTVFALPAHAQSKKELAAVDAQLSQRLTTLEGRMLTGDPAAERLMQRMDALEKSQRTLTGEVETLRFERDELAKQIEVMAAEVQTKQALIDRMKVHLDAVDLISSEVPSRSPVQSDPYTPRTYGQDQSFSSSGSVAQPDPYAGHSQTYSNPLTYSDPSYDSAQLSQIPSAPVFKERTLSFEDTYQNSEAFPNDVTSYAENDVSQLGKSGQQKLAEGDFSGAQTAFKQYLEFNPDATDKDEINFWLGESYYVRSGYADAADAYIASMRENSKGVKAPDAMVRLAAALRQLGNKAEACQTLATFPAQFPDAPSSTKEKAKVEAARTGC